eukprot:3785095-Pyramimonas_sp.AAC.1
MLRVDVEAHQGPLVQKPLQNLFEEFANSKESSWKLADKKKGWAKSKAQMVRAMLRHVSQAMLKVKDPRKAPEWLVPFFEADEQATRGKEAAFVRTGMGEGHWQRGRAQEF